MLGLLLIYNTKWGQCIGLTTSVQTTLYMLIYTPQRSNREQKWDKFFAVIPFIAQGDKITEYRFMHNIYTWLTLNIKLNWIKIILIFPTIWRQIPRYIFGHSSSRKLRHDPTIKDRVRFKYDGLWRWRLYFHRFVMGLPRITSSGSQRHQLVYSIETLALHTGHVAFLCR